MANAGMSGKESRDKPRPAAKSASRQAPLKHIAPKAAKKATKPGPPVGTAVPEPDDDEGNHLHDAKLTLAFHHLQRAGAVISLLEKESSGDLRELLEHGISLYRKASGKKRRKQSVECAFGLLRAAEHLSMAGLYESRSETRVEVAPPPRSVVSDHLRDLAPRLDKLSPSERANARRLEAMARDLLRRAESAGHDPHLEYELTMAADGICLALEEGL